MESNFMGVMSELMNSVWGLFAYDLRFPEPIGLTSSGDILLFFASCYIVADLVVNVSERRD